MSQCDEPRMSLSTPQSQTTGRIQPTRSESSLAKVFKWRGSCCRRSLVVILAFQ